MGGCWAGRGEQWRKMEVTVIEHQKILKDRSVRTTTNIRKSIPLFHSYCLFRNYTGLPMIAVSENKYLILLAHPTLVIKPVLLYNCPRK